MAKFRNRKRHTQLDVHIIRYNIFLVRNKNNERHDNNSCKLTKQKEKYQCSHLLASMPKALCTTRRALMSMYVIIYPIWISQLSVGLWHHYSVSERESIISHEEVASRACSGSSGSGSAGGRMACLSFKNSDNILCKDTPFDSDPSVDIHQHEHVVRINHIKQDQCKVLFVLRLASTPHQ